MNHSSTFFRISIWFLFLAGGAVAGILWDLSCCAHVFKNLYFHIVSFVIGLGALRLVVNASRNTGRYLAQHGKKGNVPKFETNRLVTTGYYACMRHPMHLGLLFFPLGWALMIGSVTFILIIAPIEMLLMIIMIKGFEEKEAVQKFGEAYRQYMRQTPMFSFKFKCLKALFSKDGFARMTRDNTERRHP